MMKDAGLVGELPKIEYERTPKMKKKSMEATHFYTTGHRQFHFWLLLLTYCFYP